VLTRGDPAEYLVGSLTRDDDDSVVVADDQIARLDTALAAADRHTELAVEFAPGRGGDARDREERERQFLDLGNITDSAVNDSTDNPELLGSKRHLVAPESALDERSTVDHDHVTGRSLLESSLDRRMLAGRRLDRERGTDDTGSAPHRTNPPGHRNIPPGQVADIGRRERGSLDHELILPLPK